MSKNKKVCIGISLSCVVGLIILATVIFGGDGSNPFETDTSSEIDPTIYETIVGALKTSPEWEKFNYNNIGTTGFLGTEGWNTKGTEEPATVMTGSLIDCKY